MEMVVVAVCEVLKNVCVEHELDVYSVCEKYMGVRISINSNGSIKILGMGDDELARKNGVEPNARIVRDIPASVSEYKKVNAAERSAAKATKAAERSAAKAAKAAERSAAKAAKAAERSAAKAAKAAEREAAKAAKAAEREAAKAAKSKKGSSRICGKCGESGHNRRTCPVTEDTKSCSGLLSEFNTDKLSAEAAPEAPADAEVEAPADAEVEAPADAEVVAPADAEVVAPADAEVEAPADAEVEAVAQDAKSEKDIDDELMTEPPSDDESVMFTHNGSTFIKRKVDGRQTIWDPTSGEHVGDWEGEWESDTGTIHLADSDSSDDEDE